MYELLCSKPLTKSLLIIYLETKLSEIFDSMIKYLLSKALCIYLIMGNIIILLREYKLYWFILVIKVYYIIDFTKKVLLHYNPIEYIFR
jgi:hypothetical protein